MPFERIGLGGILTFDDSRAVASMGRATTAFTGMSRASDRSSSSVGVFNKAQDKMTQKLSSGALDAASQKFQMLNMNLMGAAMAATPLAMAINSGAQMAIDFEKQMSGVAAITRASETDFKSLRQEAMRLGSTTVYTATQAAQGMELMGRAGATTKEIIEGIPGVLNAAAAESIDLATATDVVAQVIRGMRLEFSQAAHVADVLALTSASTNTTIVDMGESFKYGGAQMRAMGFTLEETAALIGKLADAGLRGSLGGTALTAMMTRLTKPSRLAQGVLDEFNVKVSEAGKMRKVSSIVAEFSAKLNQIEDPAVRAGIAARIFGVEGARAFNALSAGGKAAIDKLETNLLASSAGIGAAAEMAEKRLDNFWGQMQLFKSATEGFFIELTSPIIKMFTSNMEGISNAVQGVVDSMISLGAIQGKANLEFSQSADLIAEQSSALLQNRGFKEEDILVTKRALEIYAKEAMTTEELSTKQLEARARLKQSMVEAWAQNKKLTESEKAGLQSIVMEMVNKEAATSRASDRIRAQIYEQQELARVEQKYGVFAVAIAKGIKDAIQDVRDAWTYITDTVKQFGKQLRDSFGENATRTIARVATLFTFLSAAALPVLGVLTGVTAIVAGLASLFGAIGPFIAAAFWPVTAVIAGIGIAFMLVRNEGESAADTIIRVWTGVTTWFKREFGGVIDLFSGMWEAAGPALEILWESFSYFIGSIRYAIGELFGYWSDNIGAGTTDWKSFGRNIVGMAASFFGAILETVGWLIKGLTHVIKFVDAIIWGFMALAPIIMGPFGLVFAYIMGLWRFIVKMGEVIAKIIAGDWTGALLTFFMAIGDYVLSPMAMLAKAIVKMMKAVGREAPSWLETFAEEGFSGFVGTAKKGGEPGTTGAAPGAVTVKTEEGLKGELAKQPLDIKARKEAEGKAAVNVTVNNQPPDVTVNTHLDTEKIATSMARHNKEVNERAGFTTKPWQLRLALEHGATPYAE